MQMDSQEMVIQANPGSTRKKMGKVLNRLPVDYQGNCCYVHQRNTVSAVMDCGEEFSLRVHSAYSIWHLGFQSLDRTGVA